MNREKADTESEQASCLCALFVATCLLVVLSAAYCAPAPTQEPAPRILGVEASGLEVARYEKLELAVTLEAAADTEHSYDNPYDVRQVDLTAVFTGPGGREW